jgi:ligand-binding SRPBCC domain-containing protein
MAGLSAQFSLSTRLPAPAERVWTLLQKPQTLREVAQGWLFFEPVLPPVLPEQWPDQGGDFTVRLRAFGVLPLGHQVIAVRFPPADPEATPGTRCVLDQGHGRLVRVWAHRIEVVPEGPTHCRYTDHLRLEAGLLTPVVWLWAKGFYRHRQRRWHTLLRSPQLIS